MSLFHLSEDVIDFLLVLLIVNCERLNVHLASLIALVCSLTLMNVYKQANCALECSVALMKCFLVL